MKATQPSRPSPTTPGPFRFTRALYHRMAEQGAFDGLHVELLEGEVVVMVRIDAEHAKPLSELNRILVKSVPDELSVRTQLPLAPDDENEPEPDFAIVTRDDHADEHPTTALLAIELANTTVRDDLTRKARIYARAGVLEYWVLDVKKRELVVHRNPSNGKYKTVKRLSDLSSVKSSAVPSLQLDLRHIFVKR